jgi:hypothetical protein
MFQPSIVVGVLAHALFKVAGVFHKEESGQSSNTNSGLTMFMISTLVVLTSCFNSNTNANEINQLNLRITRLEQRIDSLISIRHSTSIESNNIYNSYPAPYASVKRMNRCQAITKKGTQCKRNAKSRGYCWQHENR